MEKKNAPAAVASEPVASAPVAAEPIAAEPVAAEPVAAEPVAAEPIGRRVASEGGASTRLLVNWPLSRLMDHFTRSANACW
ncbi:hypothetical protein QYE76_042499 [Lolium multiflorum]|uniref:Uncharacterized protein n=1 Tax=Lolium multiflorum TaxID=4521 RepID=A0AAD8TFQ3_LOLMU|nr:hypothetical protein QYE76_042499 [Lolium multiflorum]